MMSRDSPTGTNWRIAKLGYKTDKHSTSRTSGDLSGKSQRDNFEALFEVHTTKSLSYERPLKKRGLELVPTDDCPKPCITPLVATASESERFVFCVGN